MISNDYSHKFARESCIETTFTSAIFHCDAMLYIKNECTWFAHITLSGLYRPHTERRLHSKNHNRGKNGREKEKVKTKNDVTGLDDERAGHRGKWRHWTHEPASEGREPRRRRTIFAEFEKSPT